MRQLNREHRNRDVLYRLHPVWLLLYIAMFLAVFLFIRWIYSEHKENQLPAGKITLKMSKQKYQPGESIKFTLINNFPTTVYVPNYCPAEPFASFRWETKKWIPIHANAKVGSPCYQQPRRIAISAGESVSYNFDDWPKLFREPGVYRIAARIEHYSDLPFQDFVVLQPKPRVSEPTTQTTSPITVPQTPLQPQTNTRDRENDDDRIEKREPEQEVENESDDD